MRLTRAAAPPGRTRQLGRRWPRRDVAAARRLHLLQHERAERVPHPDRRRGAGRGLREGAAPVRGGRRSRASSTSSSTSRSIRSELRVATTGRYTLENRDRLATSARSTSGGPATPTCSGSSCRGRELRHGVRGLQLPHLRRWSRRSSPARASEMRFATVREQRGFRQRPQPDRHRRQRHVHQQHADRAVPRDGTRRAAAGSRQAPQVRPCRRSIACPSSRTKARARITTFAATAIGSTADITVSTDADQLAIAPGYQVSETRRERPPRRALSDRRADHALLLDPVGRLRGQARSLERRRTWPSTTTRATRTTSIA